MAKPPVVEPKKLDHAIKIAKVTGEFGLRNASMLASLFGLALFPREIGDLRVADVVDTKGAVRRKVLIRAEVAYNGYERTVFTSNQKVRAPLEEYLDWRVVNGVGLGTPGRFRGLDPHSHLYINGRTGEGFRMTQYKQDGKDRQSAMVISALFREVLQQAGVEGCAKSGRRTFAVLLGRQGKDPALVRQMMGLQSISAAKAIMKGDPVRMGDIVAKVW